MWGTYLAFPSYLDHICATVTMTTIQLRDGGPLYTAINSGQRYSLLYGPSTYLINLAGVLLFSDPIFGSKFLGVACAFLSLVGMGLLVYRLWKFPRVIFIFLYFLLTTSFFGQAFFLNRADSVMMLGCIGVAIGVLLIRQGLLSSLLIAVSAAFVCNGKIHGALYLLPMLPLAWSHKNRGWLSGTIFLTILFTVGPFFLHGISSSEYVLWLKMASRHPLSLSLFVQNIAVALAILLPIGIAMTPRHNLTNIDKQFITLLLFAITSVAIIAAKLGAGYSHFLLFCPALTIALALALEKGEQPINMAASATIAVWVMIMWTAVSIDIFHIIFICDRNYSRKVELRKELLVFKQDYAGQTIIMGYSDGDYESTFLRPLLDRPPNTPNLWDAPAMMDMGLSGLSLPESVYSELESYRGVIITPIGRPFELNSWYPPGQPLFGKRFIKTFNARFRQDKIGRYYCTWVPRD